MTDFGERVAGVCGMSRSAAWLGGCLALCVYCGCESPGPVAPLVPLPDDRMPTREALAYTPWTVLVADVAGEHRVIEQAVVAVLRQRLEKYGIRNLPADDKSSRLVAEMVRMQAASGGEVDIRDPKFEMLKADGVITVTITAVNTLKDNERSTWKDDEGKVRHNYTSAVRVTGYCTLAIPRAGVAETIRFENTDSQTSYDKRHQFNEDAMAENAARNEAGSGTVLKPIYTRFPLIGYLIGTGDHPRYVKINRGAAQGVRRDRQWELVMEVTESNPLVGRMTTEQVIGTAQTVEVQQEYCVAKCDSARTREQAKLGMKARSLGFGFSWGGLFSD